MFFQKLMLRIIRGIKSRWRNAYYRVLGVHIQGYVWLGQIDIPRNHGDIKLDSNCALDKGVVLLSSGERTPNPKICVGSVTYVNRNTFLDASLSVTIGKQCGIGPNCYITDHDHGLENNLPPLDQPLIAQPTTLGDRVWLGANVTVLKGVTVGHDAVVGAGSVVTKDIPPGAIAVGVPAKVIRYKDAFKPLPALK